MAQASPSLDRSRGAEEECQLCLHCGTKCHKEARLCLKCGKPRVPAASRSIADVRDPTPDDGEPITPPTASSERRAAAISEEYDADWSGAPPPSEFDVRVEVL